MSLLLQAQRPQLIKSIYLIGPQSTGNTTLANALLKYYGAAGDKEGNDTVPFIKETARKIFHAKKFSADDLNTSRCLEMQQEIFLAHFKEEMQLIADNKLFYISDRCAIDPIIYTQKYSKNGAGDSKILIESIQFKMLMNLYKDPKHSLVILFQPIPNFLVSDGTRKMPEHEKELEELAKLFEDFLTAQEIPFKVLGEDCKNLKIVLQKFLLGLTKIS